MLKGIIGSLLVLALVFGLTSLVLAEDTAQNPSAESQKYQPILQRLQALLKELETQLLGLAKKLGVNLQMAASLSPDLEEVAATGGEEEINLTPTLSYGVAGSQAIKEAEEVVSVAAAASPVAGPSDVVPKTVVECKGDVNRDGVENNFDIDPFRKVYDGEHHEISLFWFADINNDNVLDLTDIDQFTEILVGTRVPECRSVTR